MFITSETEVFRAFCICFMTLHCGQISQLLLCYNLNPVITNVLNISVGV